MFRRVIREQLTVPANIDYLKDLRDFVARVGKKHGISDRTINPLKLCVDEASTNIIHHAYRDQKGFITIKAIVRRNSLTISLVDQGRYFDPQQVKPPDLQRYVNIGKKGGLGIFIIRKLIDGIDYRKTEEGNELRLTKLMEKPQQKRVFLPRFSLNLKTKFSLAASAAITSLILASYLYYYSKEDDKITQEVFANVKAVATMLMRNSIGDLRDDNFLALSKNAKVVLDQNPDLLYDSFIEDATGEIKGSSDTEKFPIWEKFELPKDFVKIAEDVVQYRLATGEKVYDISKKVVAPASEVSLGKVHLLVRKSLVDDRISQQRMRDLRFALLIFFFANAAIIFLISSIMSPFKKLANWIRALGQGEIQDEVDIDASDELGEIAQAFSEITDKFRKSQRDLAEQERLQQEMQVAQEIQHTLLPSEFPQIEGYEIASYYEAAKEVGGDYFDFVEVDRDTLGIAVADVSGKGIPGSLVMTMIRTALRTEARGEEDAATVLCKVNDFVVDDMKKGMFVTLFYVILDSRRRRINFSSAGHNPMILYRGKTKKTYYLNPKGFPIGISLPDRGLFKDSIEYDTLQLTEGDMILIYTDGVTEAVNSKKEPFGDERLLKAVREYGHLRAKTFVEKLKEELLSFTEGNVQNDDITLVVIKEKLTAEEVELERAKRAFLESNNGKSLIEACHIAGIPLSTYRRKYKQRFEQEGVEKFIAEQEQISVEAKHLSIEEQTKIFDIIKNHPEYGARKISEELNTEKYGFTQISEKRVYDELVRRKLNTRELREAYVARSAKRKRMKAPGTPLLTLDGRVIIEREEPLAPTIPTVEPLEKEEEVVVPEAEREKEEEVTSELEAIEEAKKPVSFESEEEAMLTLPLEELLEKREPERYEGTEAETEEKEHVQESTEVIDEEKVGEKEEEFSLEGLLEQEVEEETSKEVDLEYLQQEVLPEAVPISGIEKGDDLEEEIEEEISSSVANEIIAADISDELLGQEQSELEKAEPVTPAGEEKDLSFVELLEDIQWEEGTSAEASRAPEEKTTEDQQAQAATVHGVGSEQQIALDEIKEAMASGLKYYKDKKYNDAIAEFERIVAQHPHLKEAHYMLGNAYYRGEMFQEAIAEYEKVKTLDPSYADAYENLGVIYANKGEYEKAILEWKSILKLYPDRQDIKKNIALVLKMRKQSEPKG